MFKHRRLVWAVFALPIVFQSASLAQLPFPGQQQQPSPFGQQQQRQTVPPQLAAAQKRFERGIQLQKANKLAAAAVEYKAVLKVVPKFVPALTNLAIVYAMQKQFAGAESTLRKILQIEPKNAFAQEQLMRVLLARGKPAEALKYARAVAAQKPKEFGPRFTLGVISMQTQNHASAVDAFRSALHIKPDDPAATYNLGFAYLNLKKYRDAQLCMEKLLKKDPKNTQAIFISAFASEQSGDIPGAVEHLENAATVMPSPVPALINIAQVYGRAKKEDKVVETFNRILKIEQDNFEANLALGRMDYAKKRYKEAEPKLALAKKAKPGDPNATMFLAMTQMNLGKLKEAAAGAQAMLKTNPKDRLGFELLGYSQEMRQKQNDALVTYRKWELALPKDPEPNRKIANVYLFQRKNDYAFKHFQIALNKAPKDTSLIESFAGALMSNGQHDRAYKLYIKSLGLKPGVVRNFISAATCLQRQKKWNEAIALLNKAIAREPKKPDAHTALASLYREQEKLDDAVAQYKKILEFAPKDRSTLLSLAQVHDTQKKYDDEIACYRTLREAEPKEPEWGNAIPRIYERMDKLDQAIEEAKKLVEADPKEASFRVSLANLLIKKPDHEGAIQQFTEMAKDERVPTQAYAHEQIGEIQEKQNKPDDAIASYKKAIDLRPDYSRALDNLSKLYDGQKKTEEFQAYVKSLVEQVKDNSPYRYYVEMCRKAGKSEEAVKTLEPMAAKNADNQALGTALASAYSEAGRKDKAVECYKKLLDKSKGDPILNRHLGDVYTSMEKHKEAVECYEAANKGFMIDRDLILKLADGYDKLGRKQDAIKSYQDYLKWDPANQEVKKKLAVLEGKKPEEPDQPVGPVAIPGVTDKPAEPPPSPAVEPEAPAPNPAEDEKK